MKKIVVGAALVLGLGAGLVFGLNNGYAMMGGSGGMGGFGGSGGYGMMSGGMMGGGFGQPLQGYGHRYDNQSGSAWNGQQNRYWRQQQQYRNGNAGDQVTVSRDRLQALERELLDLRSQIDKYEDGQDAGVPRN